MERVQGANSVAELLLVSPWRLIRRVREDQMPPNRDPVRKWRRRVETSGRVSDLGVLTGAIAST